MSRVETVRATVLKLMRTVPFRPFILSLENGDHVVISHPENIAFNPPTPDGVGGSEDFYVIANQVRLFSNFNAVTSVSYLDRGELAG